MTELYFDIMMKELEELIKGEVTSLNILSFCIHLMQIAERFPKLKGREKKDLVINVLSKYMENHNSNMGLLHIIPVFIDTSVSLDKGEMSIKLTTTCCAGIFTSQK